MTYNIYNVPKKKTRKIRISYILNLYNCINRKKDQKNDIPTQ